MAYSIYKTNGALLANVADGTLDTTSTSVALPGRNFAGYGQPQDTNFVHMVENFANGDPPKNPLKGQLWYNTGNSTLFVCPSDGETNPSSWLALSSTSSNGNSVFGNIIATVNIYANNIQATNKIIGKSLDVETANVSIQANIANLVVFDANVSNSLTTTHITTGSNVTSGNLIGAWNLDGTLNANGNISTTGYLIAENYKYANGDPFVTGSYTDSNVYNYLTGTGVSPFIGNITPGNVTGVTLISGDQLSGTLLGDSSNQPNITSVGSLVGLVVTGNIRSGNANLGNLTMSNYYAGVLLTGNQPNISNVGTLGNLTVTSNVTTGGIKTDNYYYANGTSVPIGGGGGGTFISNGSTNVTIPSLNGNVNVTVGSVANVITVTSTGANITGYANITGNVTAGNVTATRLAGNLTTNAQSNITSVGTLTGLTMGGNIVMGNSSVSGVKNITFASVPNTSGNSGSVSIYWSNAQNYLQASPTGTITYTFYDPPGPCHLQLFIASAVTGRTITWPVAAAHPLKWLGTPYVTGTSGKAAVVNFWFDGSTYWAMTATEN